MKKITFGKIQLNVNKDKDKEQEASTSGKFIDFILSHRSKSKLFLLLFLIGFGTFGQKIDAANKFNEQIEEIAEDLESQHVKEVMGISEFGRKSKIFDINVNYLQHNFRGMNVILMKRILLIFRNKLQRHVNRHPNQ